MCLVETNQVKIDRAIILAAGMGIRLRPLTQNGPKCLLPFLGRTILEYQLAQLKNLGIPDILVVAGYEAQKVIKILPPGVRHVVNSDYQNTNSVYSLYLARENLDGNILLLNSDVIYDETLLALVIDSPHSNTLLVEFDKTPADGEMNVKVQDGMVSEIGKHIPAVNADGESAQVVKFERHSAALLRMEIERMIAAGYVHGFPSDFYYAVIKQAGLYATETAGKPWFEIDTPQDYQRLCSHYEDYAVAL